SVWTSSCSGHVSSGEDYDETAPRELLEELNYGPGRKAAQVRRLRRHIAGIYRVVSQFFRHRGTAGSRRNY
ncbi:MAG TPA: NUDIX domain-containing protein, partial [Planctomycetaceae bacterium]|nr:NUDIX domain-containing protein [Planctomycetaceae bacterium]